MSNKLVFGVIGNGFVGGATKEFECSNNKLLVYDIVPEKCVPLGLKLEDLQECDFIFVCVPTPMKHTGECNLSIVDNVINKLNDANINSNIIIRSTVLPGTTNKYNCYFMPEFLTEKNYINDFINCKNWVIGCGSEEINQDFLNKYKLLINNAYNENKIKYNSVIPMLNSEAELTKYTRNCFLALKVSFFNEIHNICSLLNINYDNCIKGVVCDQRIGSSHTQVPGHDGKFGYGGTCFPKDTNALNSFAKNELNMESLILSAAIKRNETIDRPEQDWKNDKRAYSN
jgi:UDPglucose 6-dehydrogenase